MDKETADRTRTMIRRVTLKNIDDSGETQRASIEVADGIWRDDVEVLQQHGVASHAPEDGALAIALAIGGDEGDTVLIPVGNPSKRLGGLQPGQVALGNEHGDKIVISPNGGIGIEGGGGMVVRVGTLTIVAGEIVLQGNVVVQGALHATGNISSDSPDGADE